MYSLYCGEKRKHTLHKTGRKELDSAMKKKEGRDDVGAGKSGEERESPRGILAESGNGIRDNRAFSIDEVRKT